MVVEIINTTVEARLFPLQGSMQSETSYRSLLAFMYA
jgi:hypothetical protein